jgi:hypothetical protein
MILVHFEHERTTLVALRIAYYGKLIVGNFFHFGLQTTWQVSER